MAVPNLIKVVLHWSGYGEEGTISWHLAPVANAHDTAALSDYLDELDSRLTSEDTPSAWTNAAAKLTTAQTFDSLTCYQYADDDGPATSQAIKTVSHVGTFNAAISPLQASVVASLRTGIPGRSFRGRQYWPGHTTTAQVTTGLLQSGTINSFSAVAGQWGATVQDAARTSFSDDPIRWSVYSRARRSATDISTVEVDNRFDIQRRRAASQVATAVSVVDLSE